LGEPSFTGAACAIAGDGKRLNAVAAPAAVPAKSARRVTLRDMTLRDIRPSLTGAEFLSFPRPLLVMLIRRFFQFFIFRAFHFLFFSCGLF
jgi:hypothetical protein